MLLAVLGLLSAAGILSLLQLAVATGPAHRVAYAAATFTFLLSTAQAAPALALASRLGRGLWGVPVRRVADLWALAGLVTTPIGILILFQLPDWRGRPSIWLDWPGAPQVWDSLSLLLLLLVGLGLVYVTTLPDRRWRLLPAPAWRGTPRQWQVISLAARALGSLYLMTFVFVQLLVSSDLALSLVPGWGSANFPAYHAVSALEAGVATGVLSLAVLRRSAERVHPDVFHACAKLLLALALLWFYFTWSELLTLWYGRTPAEQTVLELLMFGPSLPLFFGAGLLSCVIPVGLLIWNPIRRSPAGTTAAAACVLVGTLLDRLRIELAAWSVVGPVRDRLDDIPARLPTPDLLDITILVGLPAAAVLVYLLALRVLPAVPGWELGERRLLHVERPFGRTRVLVVGKPD